MKNSVVFYKDWWDVLTELPADDRLKAYESVFAYAFAGKVPEDKFTRTITGLMRTTIDRDVVKFERISERRREAANSRWKSDANASKSMQVMQRQNLHYEKEKENENENENENDINKESKPKKGLSLPPHSTQKFVQFNQWVQTNCPHLLKMEQMTEKELDTLLLNYESEDVFNTLRSMENYKPITKNNRSVYRTLRNWLYRDNKKKGGTL